MRLIIVSALSLSTAALHPIALPTRPLTFAPRRVRHALSSPLSPPLASAAQGANVWLPREQPDPASSQTPLSPRVVTGIFTLRVITGVVLIVLAFAVSFALLERWSPVDALYYTTTTMATIGFGDLRPLRRLSQLLSSLLACVGVGLLGGLVSAVVSEYVNNEVETTPWISAASDKENNNSNKENIMYKDKDAGRELLAEVIVTLRQQAWVQVLALFGIGALGVHSFDGHATTWPKTAYLIAGTMTTAGLGDVVPITAAAKCFIALYAPLAVITFARVVGSLAARPLDDARRAAQRAVLARYGTKLTERTLNEVSRGPMVQRLDLSADDNFCTRDEFTLLNLVLQGKVSEDDLAECREAFSRLDVDKSGKLSANDLEVLAQRRLLRVQSNPRLQRRLLARVVAATRNTLRLGDAATTARASSEDDEDEREAAARTTSAVLNVVERRFPYWRDARSDGDAGSEEEKPGEEPPTASPSGGE